MKLTLSCITLLLAVAAVAAAESPGITVTERGEVMAKPNRLEVEARATGAGEISSDAFVKYRGALRTTLQGLKAADLKNVKIEPRGLGVDMSGGSNAMALRMGGNPQPAKGQFQIGSAVRVSLTGIDRMTEDQVTEALGKILDVLKDSGAALDTSGGNPLAAMMGGQQSSTPVVHFIVDDFSTARDHAFEVAFKNARGRAERWAKTAGVELGPLVSMEEVAESSEEKSPQDFMSTMYGLRKPATVKDFRLVANQFSDIPVQVTLKVRFALKGSPP